MGLFPCMVIIAVEEMCLLGEPLEISCPTQQSSTLASESENAALVKQPFTEPGGVFGSHCLVGRNTKSPAKRASAALAPSGFTVGATRAERSQSASLLLTATVVGSQNLHCGPKDWGPLLHSPVVYSTVLWSYSYIWITADTHVQDQTACGGLSSTLMIHFHDIAH